VDLRHLRAFVAIAEEQSFTRAAARLRIAQPPLSRQLQQLEAELGVLLIERGSRPARLTEPGRVLFEQAAQILDRVAEMRSIARRLTETQHGRFSIGFVASTLYGHLPKVLRDFRAARPDTELAVLELTSIEQVAALKEGRIDVGFGRIPFDDPSITRRLLRNETMVAALPTGHKALERPGPLLLSDLLDDPLIVYPKSPRPSYADQVIALYRNHGLRPASLQEVREMQTALGLVAAGLGVCLVPAAVERLQREGVAYRALGDAQAISPIIMSHRREDRSAELGLILDIIKAVYRREGITLGQ
jgi:DNA-binding transcriptional LysR family regulator